MSQTITPPPSMSPRKRKPKSEAELAQASVYNADYYQKNREKLLAEKKERYAGDPEYARGIKIRARKRHWLGERLEQKDLPAFGNLDDTVPKGTLSVVVDHPEDVRLGQTVEVPVYSTASVGFLLGRDPQILRLWWKRKQMPEPYYRGAEIPNNMVKGRNPRLFTRDELEAIDRHKALLNLPTKGPGNVLFIDAVQAEFDAMHKGLVVTRD